jgi:hypothetical protein
MYLYRQVYKSIDATMLCFNTTEIAGTCIPACENVSIPKGKCQEPRKVEIEAIARLATGPVRS